MRINGIVVVLATAGLFAGCAKEEAQSAVASAGVAAAAVDTPVTLASTTPVASGTVVKVYKDPNCGCCAKWVDHRENGFTVETMDMPDLSMIKQKYMIGDALRSCHTSVIGDYAFEGHVPADVIRKVLEEKPAIAGLAVPGMPSGSPGMEGATKERYDVLTFDRAGKTTVYAQR